MSTSLRRQKAGALVTFDPARTRENVAKADALIAYAAKVKDWPLLLEAVDAKIEDQTGFVGWWDGDDGVRGKGERANVQERGHFTAEAFDRTGITKQQVSRWRSALAKGEQYRERMIQAAFRKAGLEPEENHRAQGTGENEWFTPAQYIEAARAVMEAIDLDPASNTIAQEVVRATRYFTVADDGLAQPWSGRVWLNPPYAQPHIANFVSKLVEEFAAGNVTEAILLTHNYTDTAWFHLAASQASAFCFTRGRIRFVDPDGVECAPTQGQTFFYYGKMSGEFAVQFQPFGLVLEHYAGMVQDRA